MRHAGKDPVAGAAALALLEGVTELRVAKGRKIVRVPLDAERPSDHDLLALMLGRSGKLRAPALKAGMVMVVGYNGDILQSLWGAA